MNGRGHFRRGAQRLAGLTMGVALLAGAVCVLPCAAQQSQRPEVSLMAQNNAQVSPSDPRNGVGVAAFGENPLWAEKRVEVMNADRQKSMVANANKLLELTKKLNAEVNGAHAGALTEDQLFEVKEIEKLAHKVREEMSYAVPARPNMGPSLILPLVP